MADADQVTDLLRQALAILKRIKAGEDRRADYDAIMASDDIVWFFNNAGTLPPAQPRGSHD